MSDGQNPYIKKALTKKIHLQMVPFDLCKSCYSSYGNEGICSLHWFSADFFPLILELYWDITDVKETAHTEVELNEFWHVFTYEIIITIDIMNIYITPPNFFVPQCNPALYFLSHLPSSVNDVPVFCHSRLVCTFYFM